MWIPLADADLSVCGGKAAGLATLHAHNVRVPAGLCLPFDVYRAALPAVLPSPQLSLAEVDEACAGVIAALQAWTPGIELEHELASAFHRLGSPLVVRSSASCEDLEGLTLAGVFETTLDVCTVSALLAAIRRCWESLWRLPAWAVLRHHGRWPGQEAMGVLVQRQLDARSGGMALSRAPLAAGEILVEAVSGRPGALARGESDPTRWHLPRQGASATTADPWLAWLRGAVLTCEEALRGTVEVEWVRDEAGTMWLVQARRQRDLSRRSGPGQTRATRDALVWRWDREHNPEPLSPAHASLIELIDDRRLAPIRLAVFDGYLYEAKPPSSRDASAGPERSKVVGENEISAELALLERITRDAISERPAEVAAALQHALDRFLAFYERYATRLPGLRRGARRNLKRFLEQLPGRQRFDDEEVISLSAGVWHASWARAEELHQLACASTHDHELREWLGGTDLALPARATGVRAFLERHGYIAPCWDVATPTLAEDPALLKSWLQSARASANAPSPAERVEREGREAAALLNRLAAHVPAQRETLRSLVAVVREARASEEDDDVLFSQALWLVRAALLAAADRLVALDLLGAPEQVFGLPLELVRSALEAGAPAGLRERAEAGLATWRRQREGRPALVITTDARVWAPPPAPPLVKGLGIGGTVRGTVRLIRRPEQLMAASSAGAIAVCATVTPALAVALPLLAGLVTDHGGVLSHAASLARELGLPAVIGAQTATEQLRDGDTVWLDGQRGLVVRIDRADVGRDTRRSTV